MDQIRPDGTEILGLEESIDEFDLRKVTSSASFKSMRSLDSSMLKELELY